MPVAQGGEAEAFVVARISRVADADHRVVKQPDDGGDDALAGETAAPKIDIDCTAKARQRCGERGEARELHFIAASGPARMVAILLAATLVAAGRLEVTLRMGRDPDIAPGRRDDQASDAGKSYGVFDPLAVRPHVEEAGAGTPAANARLLVTGVDQGRARSGFFGRWTEYIGGLGSVRDGQLF